jgi:hypothetical protein
MVSFLKIKFVFVINNMLFFFYSVVGHNFFWPKPQWIGNDKMFLAASNMEYLSQPYCK